MNPKVILLLIIPVLVTIGTFALWAATGGDAYTKYEVVERVPVEESSDDLFAGTGLNETSDNEPRFETVTRKEFRFGLFPTPEGLFDKHIVSVASISGPVWAVCIGLIVFFRIRRKKLQAHPPT